MKKIISVILCSVIIVSCFVGCGNKNKNEFTSLENSLFEVTENSLKKSTMNPDSNIYQHTIKGYERIKVENLDVIEGLYYDNERGGYRILGKIISEKDGEEFVNYYEVILSNESFCIRELPIEE